MAGKRNGAVRAAFAERGDDLYETPDCATRALVREVALPKTIWEPCAGRGAIVRHLRGAGFEVVASDLVAHEGADPGITPRIDFLLERSAPAGFDCIVTNPPYKLADAFVRHGLLLCDRVVVLLRLMALEGRARSDLIDRHLRAVHPFIERLPTMHRDGWSGPRTTSGMAFAWFDFSRAPRRDGDAPVALRRISAR